MSRNRAGRWLARSRGDLLPEYIPPIDQAERLFRKVEAPEPKIVKPILYDPFETSLLRGSTRGAR